MIPITIGELRERLSEFTDDGEVVVVCAGVVYVITCTISSIVDKGIILRCEKLPDARPAVQNTGQTAGH